MMLDSFPSDKNVFTFPYSPTSTIMEHHDGHHRPIDRDIPKFIFLDKGTGEDGDDDNDQDDDVEEREKEESRCAHHDSSSRQLQRHHHTPNDSAPRLPHRRSSAKTIQSHHIQELEELFDACHRDLKPLQPRRVLSVGQQQTDSGAGTTSDVAIAAEPCRRPSVTRRLSRFMAPLCLPALEGLSPTVSVVEHNGLAEDTVAVASVRPSAPWGGVAADGTIHYDSSMEVLMSSKPFLMADEYHDIDEHDSTTTNIQAQSVDNGNDDDDDDDNDSDDDDDDSFLLPFMAQGNRLPRSFFTTFASKQAAHPQRRALTDHAAMDDGDGVNRSAPNHASGRGDRACDHQH